MASLHSASYFFFLYRSPSSSLCMVFDSVSCNIDEVLWIKPSANVFVFGDFNVHHKDWLTYSGGTDRLVNYVIIFLSQMTLSRWLTFLLASQTVILMVLLCSNFLLLMLQFVLRWFSLHWEILIYVVVSMSIEFTLNSQQDAPFHHIAYDYSRADWDGLHDHLRDVPWKDIFKLGASAAASEFYEWLQVGIDVYIPPRKHQVKPHSSPWFSAACAAAIVHRNHFFRLYQKDKSSASKVKFRQTSNHCKRVVEAAKLSYANKTKESITSQRLGSRDFWRIANSVLNKGKSVIPPLFNGPKVLSSASDEAKLFAESFSKNSNLDDSCISLPVIPSRTNLKLHNISVTLKMVKRLIMSLDLSKASGPDCISVVVLKNCEPELSYILAELFNKCLKESCFPDCWKVSSVVPVFRNVGERSTAKNYCHISLLSVVSKVFEKLVNNRIVNHLEKCGLFADFQYGFRPSRSTADLLAVVSDTIARTFDMSGTTRAVALDISKAFQVRYLALFFLFSVIDGFEWFWMESLLKNIQLMLKFLKGPFLVLHFSCCISMTFLMMLSAILLSVLMMLPSILSLIKHVICGNNLNWLLNLNLIYETLWTGVRSGLLISMLGKISCFRSTRLIAMVLLM